MTGRGTFFPSNKKVHTLWFTLRRKEGRLIVDKGGNIWLSYIYIYILIKESEGGFFCFCCQESEDCGKKGRPW